MQGYKVEAALEALLFAANNPLPTAVLAEVLELEEKVCVKFIKEYAESLKAADRGILLRQVAEGWQLSTKPELAELVSRLAGQRKYKLSKPTLETLAIIAYKQPITRAEIEDIRGVKVEKALITLLEKELVIEVGRKDAIGRPILYGTTPFFLEYFGLKSLNDLLSLFKAPM